MKTINMIETDAKEFAYDGCHKIYILESEEDKKQAIDYEYKILPISKLKSTYNKSCPLKFISNWSLTTNFIKQCEVRKL